MASLPFAVRQWAPIKGKASRTAQTISYMGPFFEKDPLATYQENLTAFLEKVAAEGETDVKAQIASVAGQMHHYTGWTRGTVRGRVRAISGKRWRKTAVVSTYTGGMGRDDAIRTKAAGATIERRWHVFRRSTSRLRKASRGVDLTKGMS